MHMQLIIIEKLKYFIYFYEVMLKTLGSFFVLNNTHNNAHLRYTSFRPIMIDH